MSETYISDEGKLALVIIESDAIHIETRIFTFERHTIVSCVILTSDLESPSSCECSLKKRTLSIDIAEFMNNTFHGVELCQKITIEIKFSDNFIYKLRVTVTM